MARAADCFERHTPSGVRGAMPGTSDRYACGDLRRQGKGMGWKRVPLNDDEIAGIQRVFKKRPKFLIDENLGDDAAEWLRSRGHNVKTVRELGKAGASDQEIYQLARRQGRMLMTRDDNDCRDDGACRIAGS